MAQEQPQSWIQGNYRSFNGLRGLAVLMVFINHYGPFFMRTSWAMTLWPGVDLFFVLSGFLITGILYDSRESSSYFRNFYIRRALRIFPIYYGFFVIVALLTPVLHLRYDRTMIWSHLLYVSNLMRYHPSVSNPTVFSIPFHGELLRIGLGHLWSLCVEEHFYLLWPLTLFVLPDRRAMMRFCAIAVGFTVVLRSALYFYNPIDVAKDHYLYFVTYTRWDALFVGAWFALWLRGTKLTRTQLHRIAYNLSGTAAFLLAAGALTVGRRWVFNEVNPLLCTYGYTLIEFVSAGVLLLALDDTTVLSRCLRNRTLSRLGLISYGFYFVHNMPFPILQQLYLSHRLGRTAGALLALAAFGFAYLVAWISFHFYEAQFIRLKGRLAPSHRSVPSGREDLAIGQ